MAESDDATLVLPRLVSSREAAGALLDELGALDQRVVVLNARDLRSASPSSADEFVKQVLLVRGAEALDVAGAADDFLEDLTASAKARGVADKLHTLELS